MRKLHATTSELKRQRDALARFERYLPTLRLKQRQLQVEVRRVDALVRDAQEAEARLRRDLSPWVALLSEGYPIERHRELEAVRLSETNIAGVGVPTLEGLTWRRSDPSPAATPTWVDEAVVVLEALTEGRLRRRVLELGRQRLADELRVTTQRVNLFEKVQVPAAKEAMRVIRIALGDRQAAAVVRAKIAKAAASEREVAT
jgi:V/A-type H+/Na+-transporting ATPase subunit D